MVEIARPLALDEVVKLVIAAELKVIEFKKAANALALAVGLPPEYMDDSLELPRLSSSHIRPDQFANFNAQSSAARAFLEGRGKSVGAATFEDIFAALKAGGYPFDGSEEQDKANLKVALGKDVRITRLNNGTYGMSEWYPNMRREKPAPSEKSPRESKPDGEAPQVEDAARAANLAMIREQAHAHGEAQAAAQREADQAAPLVRRWRPSKPPGGT